MQNPITYKLENKNTWYKIASSVTNGKIDVISYEPHFYSHTYRIAGDDAPTDTADAIRFYSVSEDISATEIVDVYVRCSLDDAEVVISL